MSTKDTYRKVCSRGHTFRGKTPCPLCYPGYYVKKAQRRHLVRSKVWMYPGMAGWHFVSLNKKLSAQIKKNFGYMGRGWGSLPVIIQVKKTTWKTSIFPDHKTKTYLLPLKKEVRTKEKIVAGKNLDFVLEIL